MDLRRLIIGAAVVLCLTIFFWTILPIIAADILPLQMVFGAIVYLLEILLLTVLIMSMIEGSRKLIVISAVTGLIIGILAGSTVMPVGMFVPIWLKLVAPGLALGILINRGRHPAKSFAVASLLIGLFILLNYLQGIEVLNEQLDEAGKSLVQIFTAPMTTAGYSTEAIDGFTDSLTYMLNTVRRLLPGMMIMSGIGQLFIAFILTEWYYRRKDSYFPGFGPFIYWKIPEKLLYILGVVLIVRLAVPGGLQVAADNIIFILSVLYAVCGLALVEHILRRLRLPLFIRAIFYLGLFVMHIPGLIITSIAGLFDSYFDFRKVRAHTLG